MSMENLKESYKRLEDLFGKRIFFETPSEEYTILSGGQISNVGSVLYKTNTPHNIEDYYNEAERRAKLEGIEIIWEVIRDSSPDTYLFISNVELGETHHDPEIKTKPRVTLDETVKVEKDGSWSAGSILLLGGGGGSNKENSTSSKKEYDVNYEFTNIEAKVKIDYVIAKKIK